MKNKKYVFVVTNDAMFQDCQYFEVLGAYGTYDKALEEVNLLFEGFFAECEDGVYSEFPLNGIKVNKMEYQDGCEYTILSLDEYYNSYVITKVELE